MRPSQTIQVLEDLRNSFGGPLYRKRIELSLNDNQTVLDVYQQWLLLMVDLGYLHHDALFKEAGRIFADMVKRDVLDLNNAMAELLSKVRTQDFRGFKALCTEISYHLYNLVKADKVACSQGDVYAAKRLVQLFSYTSRLTLHDIDLTQQCLDDYVRIEDQMSTYIPKSLSSSLNSVIKRWMKSFDPSRIHFNHGPGGVAGHGRTSLEVKYQDLTTDAKLNYAFGGSHWVHSPIPSTLDRISQTIFVPKSYKTFRTISMESSTLQYCQQGVWKEIDRVVSANRYLVNRIGFHEQGRNQRMAQQGSINRNYATIDLSAASDSVSYALVKRLFRGTKLLRYIVATRSSRTLLPDGRLIDLKKFAPMGSALCFPIETIVFASICEFVAREHGVPGDYSVFGDDIIVPTQCVEDTMLILETLGFSVNREKSFYTAVCWFRESCGAEYCDGFDVTPMRVSRRYQHGERLVRLTGLIDLANSAYIHGYRTLRQFFLRKLREAGFSALFSPTEVLSDNYTNYHTRRRWNFDLQRIECDATSIVTKASREQNEVIRLRHWLENTHTRARKISRHERYQPSRHITRIGKNSWILGDGFVSNIGKTTVLLKDRWRVKPYEDTDQSFIDFFTQ